jgi:hypothetical protein
MRIFGMKPGSAGSPCHCCAFPIAAEAGLVVQCGGWYGYFFWERDYDTACGPLPGWSMAGNGGNAIVILRPLRTAMVVTRTNDNTRGMHQQTADLPQRYVLAALPCEAASR